jgi:hypothetical protein
MEATEWDSIRKEIENTPLVLDQIRNDIDHLEIQTHWLESDDGAKVVGWHQTKIQPTMPSTYLSLYLKNDISLYNNHDSNTYDQGDFEVFACLLKESLPGFTPVPLNDAAPAIQLILGVELQLEFHFGLSDRIFWYSVDKNWIEAFILRPQGCDLFFWNDPVSIEDHPILKGIIEETKRNYLEENSLRTVLYKLDHEPLHLWSYKPRDVIIEAFNLDSTHQRWLSGLILDLHYGSYDPSVEDRIKSFIANRQ